MKHTKLIFQITALFIALAPAIAYAKDTPPQNRSQIALNSEEEYNQDLEFSSVELEKMRLQQEERFDGIKSQADNILYSLQQVEQVLIANKIKFNETKISKKDLLREIKAIKADIEGYYEAHRSLPASQGIHLFVILNKGFMDFLLICMNDATMFNYDKFQAFLDDMFNPESTWAKNLNLETYQDFENLMLANEKNCAELMDATENFGLTSFNKAFRYFQDQSMSLTGKPLMTTCQDIALYGSLAALICGTAIYVATENNIPDYLKTVKTFIGDVTKVGQNQNNSTDHTPVSLGLFGSIDNTFRNFAATNGNLLASILSLVVTHGKPLYDWTLEKSNVTYNKTISYLRGEVDKTANSKFESQTQDVYFQEMIGAEHLEAIAEELADFIKHPQRYENTGISPEKGFLLTGPSQTGKSFFAQALQTKIKKESGENGENTKFLYVTKEMVWQAGLDSIFAYARKNAPFILFIDEIDLFGPRRDKDSSTTGDLLTNMSGLSNDKSKKVMVIGATNRPEELDFALLQDGRFGHQIRFEKPTYEHRKQHLIKTVIKRNIKTLSAEYIDAIAQETEGSTFNTLDKIITNAMKIAMRQARPVSAKDFEESLDYHFRQIRTNVAMNDKEKEVVAMYHAGQATARHLLSTIQQVVKITIHAVDKPVKGKEGFAFETNSAASKGQNVDYVQDERIRAIKLGNVFTLSTSNNLELLSDQDQENELLALLAGQATLELVKGQAYNNFGKEDRAKILHTLEIKLSQGGPINDAIRKEALAQKDILTKKIKDILAPHTQLINIITDALLDHHTIDKYEWTTIIQNYKK